MLFDEKSTEELNDLLAMSFFEDAELDVAYIEMLLDAIREREGTAQEIDQAWAGFTAFVKSRAGE